MRFHNKANVFGTRICTHATSGPTRIGMRAASCVLVLVAAGCSTSVSTADEGDGPVVLASNSIWADIVRNLVCDRNVEVRSIVPAGVDAHSFELSLNDQAAIDSSAAVVLNGLGLDDSLGKAVAAAGDGGPRLILAGEAAHEAIHARDGDAHDEGDEADEEVDPHVWMDPTAVAGAVNPIIAGLSEGLDRPVSSFQPCVDAYQKELRSLNARLAAQLAKVPEGQRELVSNHDNLGYFAELYGLGIAGTVLPSSSTLATATPQALAALGDTMKRLGVAAIFVDSGISDTDARALAQSVGDVKVVTLYTDTLSKRGEGASTYLEFMEQLGDSISTALTDT